MTNFLMHCSYCYEIKIPLRQIPFLRLSLHKFGVKHRDAVFPSHCQCRHFLSRLFEYIIIRAPREDLSQSWRWQPRSHAGGMLRTRLDISLTFVLILRFTGPRGRISEGAIKPEVFPARCDS